MQYYWITGRPLVGIFSSYEILSSPRACSMRKRLQNADILSPTLLDLFISAFEICRTLGTGLWSPGDI